MLDLDALATKEEVGTNFPYQIHSKSGRRNLSQLYVGPDTIEIDLLGVERIYTAPSLAG